MAFLPAWRPMDPASTLRLLSAPSEGGRVVALASSPRAVMTDDAAPVAAELAAGWALRGVPVLLADGALALPGLHRRFGRENGPGTAEALLGHGPVEPATHPTAVEGLRLVLAGEGAPDRLPPDARDRLASLCRTVRETGATLAMHVPLGTELAGWLLDSCTDIVVIAAPGESLEGLLPPDEDRVRAVVGPEPPPAAAPPASEPPLEEAAATDDAGREDLPHEDPLMAVPPEVEAAPPPASEPAGAPEPAAEADTVPRLDLPSPPILGRAPLLERDPPFLADDPPPLIELPWDTPRRRRRRLAANALGVVAVVALAAGTGYVAWRVMAPSGIPDSDIPEVRPPVSVPERAMGEAPTEDAPPVEVAEVEVAPHQPFSWSVAAYGELSTASTTAERFRRAAPGTLFFVTPVEVEGRTFYRLLAGVAATRAELSALRAPLAEALDENAAGWLEREVPLAMAFGEHPTEAEARAAATALEARGVPTYVLAVEYSPGPIRFRIYAGAYADAEEAAELRRLVEAAGVEGGELVERRGTLPE